MLFLFVCAALYVCTEQHIASCDLRLHKDGTVIGRAEFSTIPGEMQEVVVALMHPKISDGKHGFHVHAAPVQGDDCLTTGGHYNPDGVDHGAAGGPASSRHVGDFGNIDASFGLVYQTLNYKVGSGEDGYGTYYVDTDRFVLEGERSLVGRAVVLHAGTDDLGKGGNEGSRKTGNAGSRLACCTLE